MVDDDPADANTLAANLAPTARDSVLELPVELELPAAGYQIDGVIGRGGMGEVIAARDRRIGRQIALKRLHEAQPDSTAIARFLREARIQACLDHPAIVPVYELGTDDQGRLFFTMKRLAGVTLAERLTDGTARNRLLGAFVDVCHAIAFAHARGVIHRDVKPSNIMLGDYGEVYVLDWGVARMAGESMGSVGPAIVELDPAQRVTETGALLGTPGYMAPEQIDGRTPTPAVDVYALGAVLFEILTREPLHPRGSGALAHTLAEPQALPSRRQPEAAIPPELDRVCHEALAADPERRPSVRELADRVQAYLDGDRDLEQRRALASAQLAEARTALDAGDRAAAIHRAGRALALDPEATAAVELVTKLIVEPPPSLPLVIRERIARADREATRLRIPKAVFAFLSPFAFVLALPFLEVRSWEWLAALFVALATTGTVTLVGARIHGQTSIVFLMFSLLVGTVLWSRLAGPLVLTPVMICGVLIALAAHPKLTPRPTLLLAWAGAAVALPLVLELVGVLPASLHGTPDGLLTTSTIFGSGSREHAVVIVANAVFVLVVAFYASHVGRAAAVAQRELHVQAWHLEQLLPTRAKRDANA